MSRERSLATEIPAALDYLEEQLGGPDYLFGSIGIADIAIATFFRNAEYAGYRVDSGRWPKTAGFVDHVLGHAAFGKLHRLELIQLSASIAGRRQALIEAGARLTAESFGEKQPRRGIMRL